MDYWPLGLFLLIGLSSAIRFKCPDGWMGVRGSTSCFRFIEEAKPFMEAQGVCQSSEGHLAYIQTPKEHQWLTMTIGKLSGMDTNKTWWMGLSFDEEVGHYRWLDKTELNATIVSWSPGYPGTSRACGVLDQKGLLRTGSCNNEAHYYVCQRPIGAPIPCGDGWQQHSESCYKIYLGPEHHSLSFEEARMTCHEYDSDLVVINTEDENKFLYAEMRNEEFWIGIQEQESDHKFFWVNSVENGSPGVLSNWLEGQPHAENGTKAGVMASLGDGKWTTKNLYEVLPFVCEKPKNWFCQLDLLSFGNSCFEFHPDAAVHDWQSADRICTDLGLKLIVVEDQEENDFINLYCQHLPASKSALWLGYIETEVNSKKFKRITDGKTLVDEGVYSNLMEPLEFSDTELDALIMHISFDSPGKWSSRASATGSAAVGCKVPKGTIIDVSGSMHPKEKCPDGKEWTNQFGVFCYASFVNKMTWAQARMTCKASHEDADLVSIESDFENDHINVLTEALSGQIWIGLNKRSSDQWQWSDGSWSAFTKWAKGHPQNSKCGYATPDGWKSGGCDSPLPFICKVKAIPEGGSELPETTAQPPYPNCGAGWIEDVQSGLCYRTIEGSFKWTHAAEECAFEGGHLASIWSQQEQDFLFKWLKGRQQIWIGLSTKNPDKSYGWSDRSPVAFINWDDDAPQEHKFPCVAMDTDNSGHWIDLECSMAKPAICKKPGVNYVEPTKPDLNPKPKCPQRWKDFYDRCYFFSDILHDSTERNWAAAYAMCPLLHPAANLVSIRNLEDENYLKDKVWQNTFIGGTDVDDKKVWTWVDGSPWTFSQWDKGQPDGGSDENCLEMRNNGLWNDIGCSEQLHQPYICAYENVICPEHWTYFNKNCWLVSREQADWDTAELRCKSEHSSAHLASILDPIDNQFVAKSLFSHHSWIGFRLSDTGLSYEWIDGSPADFRSWADGEPNNANTQKCAVITELGTWKSEECGVEKDFVCRLKPTHYKTCPKGWEKFRGFCYLVQTSQMDFELANHNCNLRGSELASIWDDAENDFVTSAIHFAVYGKCPDDWIYDEVFKKCYFVAEQLVTWSDGVKYCNVQGGTLLKIESAKKGQRIHQLCNTVPKTWIGATDHTTKGVWKWQDDGSSVTYFNWATGEPSQAAGANFAFVAPDAMTWGALGPDVLLNYICEKDPPDFPTPIQSTHVWIGLNDVAAPNTFTWTDGSGVFYTNWNKFLPNKHLSDSYKSCNKISTEKGKWFHEDCKQYLMSVCKTRQTVTDIKPETFGCAEGQIEYEASCYEIKMLDQNFDGAQQICSAEEGGHLATFSDWSEEAKVIAEVSQTVSMELYIGMKVTASNSISFSWINGDPMGHTNWAKDQPDQTIEDEGSELCVLLKDGGDGEWSWVVGKCIEKRHFICEHPRRGYTTPTPMPSPTTSTKSPLQCYPGWSIVQRSCFKRMDNKLKFDDASAYCIYLGGRIASFESKDQEKATIAALKSPDAALGFVGLVNSGKSFSWTDGTPLSYVSWHADNPRSEDDCVLIYQDEDQSNSWISTSCDIPQKFICEQSASEELPSTTLPPTLGPEILCHDGQSDGWIRRNATDSFCYKFFSSSNNMSDWHEAEQRCRSEEAHLASIHSQDENDFIRLTLSSGPYRSLWIGLNSLNEDDKFVWTDGSPDFFTDWADGEPNHFDEIESCAELYSVGWKDTFCNKRLAAFVCKKPREGGWTTPVPTVVPEGHCPENTYEFRGHCYTVVTKADYWLGAKEGCQSLGPGYQLASIHSDKENAALANLMLTTLGPDQDAWIGLNIPFYEPDHGFIWIDQSSMDFDNWAPDQPSQHISERCAVMLSPSNRYFGRWESLACYDELPFICSTKTSTDHLKPPDVPHCAAPHQDFVSFDGNCFLFVKDSLTWALAEDECRKRSAHLASIVDLPSQFFLLNEITSPHAWIGLSNNQENTPVFKWTDGNGVHFTNWAVDPTPGSESVCVTFGSADGKWHPESCEAEFAYVCKYSTKPDPGPHPSGLCADGYQTYNISSDFCYKLVDPGVTGDDWLSADSYCKGQGGDLVSIHSYEDNYIFMKLAQRSQGNDIFIGLTSADEHGNFHWTDGSGLDYTNWAQHEPQALSCGLMEQTSGLWATLQCNEEPDFELSFICQKRKKVEPTSSTAYPTTSSTSTSSSSTSSSSTSSTSSTTSSGSGTSTTTSDMHITPSGHLSPGKVAGIVIGSLLLIGAAVVALVVWQWKAIRLFSLFSHVKFRNNQA